MPFVIHHHLIDKLAFFNGLISGIALYPQVYSVLVSGAAGGISLSTFLMIFINSVVWTLYAMHRSLISLLLASILNAIASGILVISILTFN